MYGYSQKLFDLRMTPLSDDVTDPCAVLGDAGEDAGDAGSTRELSEGEDASNGGRP